MSWKSVGQWVKDNAKPGAALIGSLLTGNVPGAVAAGVSMIAEATGSDEPMKALAALQTNPETMVRLEEIAQQEKADIRRHIESMKRLELEDLQHSHHETQQTIRSGDNSGHWFVRSTRPGQSWLSLVFAFCYVWAAMGTATGVDLTVLIALLTLPWAYAGLREVGKGVNVYGAVKAAKSKTETAQSK